MKNPRKWDDPNKPIWALPKPNTAPDNTSSGPTPPDESCSKMTDKNRAANEITMRIGAKPFVHLYRRGDGVCPVYLCAKGQIYLIFGCFPWRVFTLIPPMRH
jgi:hypothetical protein